MKYIEHNSYAIVEISTKILHWVITNMILAIDAKKDRLMKLKPGTLTPAEPKIIWVKMINRLYQYDKTLMVRHKYNAALEDILAGK